MENVIGMENTIEIETLLDVKNVFGWEGNDKSNVYSETIDKIEKRLRGRLLEEDTVKLTALQKVALRNQAFRDDWSDPDRIPKHLIIQGATSAGKTLLSELNILDVVYRGYQAIVLVPLKAMVHERTKQFEGDLEGQGLRVYGSSSDYMDNDERLINGDYDIAVIVYEKYYAMLSQNGGAILDACRLLVVDELSMLNREERGPKLEMALEITRIKNPRIRIMCLATSDCKTTKIKGWLGESTQVIQSPLRPVGLDEYIINSLGIGKHRYIPSEKEFDSIYVDAEQLRGRVSSNDEEIEIPGYHNELREVAKKEKFLMAVIRKIYQENFSAKTLVFAATKAETVRYADLLAKQADDIFGEVVQDDGFKKTLMEIETCDKDEDRDQLKYLMQRGIGYHNSGVSTNLREIVEAAFQRNSSPVKVIVATETLTVGVNMPFDAMVMMDCRVPKGRGEKKELTGQEYRNYIGRAGRLGQSNKTGQTYLYVRNNKDLTTFWDSFDKEPVEISSALRDADEVERTPYFLGLLAVGTKGGRFDINDIEKLYESSLSKIFDTNGIEAEKIQNELYDKYLADVSAKKKQGRGNLPGFEKEEPEQNQLIVSDFGEDMAPFALSMETCLNIYYYFLNGQGNEGLPKGVTREQIDTDYYLLEILYHICCHTEIAQSSNLMMPKGTGQNATRIFTAISIVKKKLKSMLGEKDQENNCKHGLWKGEKSELKEIAEGSAMEEQTENLQAAMRAILIYYWTQGKTIKEIRTETGFDKFLRIINGDVERLAEVISFHLDAIYKCLTRAQAGSGMVLADASALIAFYMLQTRVKYGMNRDLVILANKHVHGLDRSRILEFGKLAEQMERTPLELLMTLSDKKIVHYMTLDQKNQLCQSVSARYKRCSRFSVLIDMVKKDIGGEFSEELAISLQNIFDWDGTNAGEFINDLKNVLNHREHGKSIFGKFSKLDHRETDPFFVWKGECRKDSQGGAIEDDVQLAILTKDASELGRIKNFLKMKPDSEVRTRMLVIANDSKDMWEKQKWTPDEVDVVISCRFFAELLVNAIARQGNCDSALLSLFLDVRGVFVENQVDGSIQNYIVQEREPDSHPRFRLLRASGDDDVTGVNVTKLLSTLSNSTDIADFEVLPWGHALEEMMEDPAFHDFADCLTIICLRESYVLQSRSLTKFLFKMSQQNYRNCAILLESEQAWQRWCAASDYASPFEEKWIEKNNQIPHKVVSDVPSAVGAVREIVRDFHPDGFLIGVSYAHYESCKYPEDCYDSDLSKLKKLVEALQEEYGEHRIFFDLSRSSKEVFISPKAPKYSLDAYRQCRFFLVLSNWWTHHNAICEKEMKVMEEKYQAGEASYMYLTTHSEAHVGPDEEYTNSIDEIEEVKRHIRKYLESDGTII